MAKSTQFAHLNRVGRSKQTAPAAGLQTTPSPAKAGNNAPDYPTRWRIDFRLTTLGLLHLGSGAERQLTQAEHQGDPDEPAAERPFAATLVRDVGGHPQLPGASLKGVLRQRASDEGADAQWIDRVFGASKSPTRADGRSTLCGNAEFRAAWWRIEQDEDQTRQALEVRTAIDRYTQTVADGKLFHAEVVLPNAEFDASIVLHWVQAADVAVLQHLLNGCSDANPLRVGAHTRSGWGAVRISDIQVHAVTRQSLQSWWNEPLPADGSTRAWPEPTTPVDLAGLLKPPGAAAPGKALTLKLTLQFDGPFAARDPAHRKVKGDNQPNTKPRERDGKPMLPATSFLGALRSRAECILRTMGVNVPQGHAARTVRTGEQPDDDLASLLFGCAGWRGLVGTAGDLTGSLGSRSMTQHMVALCRITGGGQDGAKFALKCWESPVLVGHLTFDQHRFKAVKKPSTRQAALGLLHLLLAELAYGDIGFGMARSKGWGWIKEDETLLCRLETDWWAVLVDARLAGGGHQSIHKDLLQALHGHAGYTPPENHDLPVLANVPQPASPAAEERLPTLFRGPGKAGQEFHNPYHFLPFARLRPVADATADLGSVANLPRDAERLKHSHDRYHQQRFSGRLVVNLTTKTPLFIGAERGQDQGDDPVPVSGFEFDGQPAIPGTSLRGMLGALIEPMSGSAMRIIDAEQMLSVRLTLDDASLPLRERGVIAKVGDQQGVPSLRIKHQAKTDLNPMYYPIPDRAAELLYALADERWRAVGKDLALDTEAQRNELRDKLYQKRDPAITTGSGRSDSTKKGQVVLLPAIDWDNLNDFGWPRNKDVDKPKSQARLMPHQVVYFRWDGPSQGAASNKPVAELAWSQVYRRTCWVEDVAKPGPLNLGRQVQLENINRLPLGLRPNPRLHAAEWLLGAVEQRAKASSTNPALAFASKLSVGMARSASAIKRLPPTVLKELSSPKPPSPALYLRRNGPVKGGISKAELLKRPKNFVFQGTKVYLHALRESGAVAKLSEFGDIDHKSGKCPWATQRPAKAPSKADEDKDYHLSKRQAKVEPIADGESFSFTIRFTNLSTDELGLLCAAVHPSENFEHHLGMGRPVGLGSVKLSLGKLEVIDRDQRLIDGSEALVGQDPQLLAAQAMMKLKDADRAFWRGLLLLGEPGRVRCPVHYPQVTPGTLPEKKRNGTQPPAMKGRIENLNYQWWVANDKLGANGQALKPLAEIPESPEAGR